MVTRMIDAIEVPIPHLIPCREVINAIGAGPAIMVTNTKNGMSNFNNTNIAVIAVATAACVIYLVRLTVSFIVFPLEK